MLRTTGPITSLTVERVTDNTTLVVVETTMPVHLVWPHVRARGDVPQEIRAVSTVFTRKMDTDDLEKVRAAIIDDVSWRWDRGYVSGTRCAGGWMFGWSAGERD